jgi:hypothetical protein
LTIRTLTLVLAPTSFAFEDRGEIELKGIASHRLYAAEAWSFDMDLLDPPQCAPS